MKRNNRFGTIPGGNPLANVLMLVVGALAIGAAVVLGFLAFIVLSGIVLVLAAIVGLRLWWFRRKLRNRPPGNDDSDAGTRGGTRVIEGEYTVVSTRAKSRE